MINKTRPEDISLAIKAYKEARTEDIMIIHIQVPITYYMLHRSLMRIRVSRQQEQLGQLP